MSQSALFPELEQQHGELLCSLSIDGPPRPWERPSPFIVGGRVREAWPRDSMYRAWRERLIPQLAMWWAPRRTIYEPVVAYVICVFPRPERAPTTFTVKGHEVNYPWPWTPARNRYVGVCDFDNLGKAVMDVVQREAATRGPAAPPILADDRLVVDGRVAKWFAAEGEPAHTELRLWRA